MDSEGISSERQDVVVVGAGCAGLTAAVAAVEAKAKTVVLEKAPDISNTNTCRSPGGDIVIAMECEVHPDAKRLSVEEKAEEAVKATDGQCDPELIRAWAANIDDTLKWLGKAGLKWARVPGFGLSTPATMAVSARGGGPGLNKQLLSIAERKGCRVRFNTRAERLLTDSMGRIAGVRARTVDGIKDFEAAAVVLATAGFQANQEMLLRYMGSEFAYGARLTGSPFATGDGHLMAQEVGAKLVNMDVFHVRNIDETWVPGCACSPGPIRELQTLAHYSIFVNKLGKRFMDEVDSSNIIAHMIVKQPGQEIAIIFDEKIRAVKPEDVEKYLHPGVLRKATSIEEVASKIGVPYEQLKQTIEEFNYAVKDGKALDLAIPKRDCAMKIETPPFYFVYPVWFGLNCTLGGAKITAQAQVVDRDDVPTPGLFAAGEVAGGFWFGRYYTGKGGVPSYKGNYHVTTASISTCLVFGHIAGRNAARLAKLRE